MAPLVSTIRIFHRPWVRGGVLLSLLAETAQLCVRLAAGAALPHHCQLWQQLRQGAHGGAFGGTLLPHHQKTADTGIDHVQDQGCLQLLLTDNGRKRKIHASDFFNSIFTLSPPL